MNEVVASSELLGWLRDKIAAAEKHLNARVQAERTWRSGDDESWRKASVIDGLTMPTKKERLAEAERQRRISVKCRREVEMFKAALNALNPPTHKGQP